MQNSIPKFRQRSIVFEKPGILHKKLKTLTSTFYYKVEYFLLKLFTRFALPMSTKGCSELILFLLRFRVMCKN